MEWTTGMEYWRGGVDDSAHMRTECSLTPRVVLTRQVEDERSVEIMDSECRFRTFSDPIVIDDDSPTSTPARSPVKILNGIITGTR